MKKLIKNTFSIIAITSVVGYMTHDVYAVQNKVKDFDLVLANIEALSNDEGGGELGCGGNPTFLRDRTLKSTLCPPLWLGGSHLKCKSELNVCCDPSKQTDCDSPF